MGLSRNDQHGIDQHEIGLDLFVTMALLQVQINPFPEILVSSHFPNVLKMLRRHIGEMLVAEKAFPRIFYRIILQEIERGFCSCVMIFVIALHMFAVTEDLSPEELISSLFPNGIVFFRGQVRQLSFPKFLSRFEQPSICIWLWCRFFRAKGFFVGMFRPQLLANLVCVLFPLGQGFPLIVGQLASSLGQCRFWTDVDRCGRRRIQFGVAVFPVLPLIGIVRTPPGIVPGPLLVIIVVSAAMVHHD
mmetsp:Transcript_7961/g.19579  ORF Transcript_7961/g.19579 Transcript_7961/m.19579 type:complete len:246 (+) Transcript_7961:706-1443(+)